MIEVAFRTVDSSIPRPRSPVLLSAEEKGYTTAQPWQCKPWRDAQTLGLELLWTEDFTLTVTNVEGKAYPQIDKSAGVTRKAPDFIQNFAEGYYGVSTGCQLLLPVGFAGLILPHARSFDLVPDGCFNDLPAVIPGLLEMDWWPAIFFIVCAIPRPGEQHVFYAGEPFCQVVPVPRGDVSVRPMNEEETVEWHERDEFVRARRLSIATHTWKTPQGGVFANA